MQSNFRSKPAQLLYSGQPNIKFLKRQIAVHEEATRIHEKDFPNEKRVINPMIYCSVGFMHLRTNSVPTALGKSFRLPTLMQRIIDESTYYLST